jgi:uncharacterized membrane protein
MTYPQQLAAMVGMSQYSLIRLVFISVVMHGVIDSEGFRRSLYLPARWRRTIMILSIFLKEGRQEKR